jgi:hypothetical protein
LLLPITSTSTGPSFFHIPNLGSETL